jgi:SAM-dependent methyltransferase
VDATTWDERYRAREMLWSRGPNVFVESRLADREPGVGLDLASGEGRNAIWLAERGWDMTAVDFSSVAVERGRKMSDQVEFIVADVFEWEPDRVSRSPSAEAQGASRGGVDEGNSNLSSESSRGDEGNSNLSSEGTRGFDLVLIAYLHVDADRLRNLIEKTGGWLRPGGELFLVGHDVSNIAEGVGGPQVPEVLWEVDPILEWIRGLELVEGGVVDRPVEVDGDVRYARDTLIRARAPATVS